ncbi:MAG: TolC family outer membrane protein [Gammaproteobacteria bacterium]|nr:TolC family outer membrane protein [Gammaproteobacteria bacterium]
MKIAPRPLVALIAALTCAGLSGAAQADSLYEIYQLAQERDPTLRAAAAARDATLEVRPQSRAGLLPIIGLSGDVSRNSYEKRNPLPGETDTTFSTNQSYGLNLTQPVFRWDRWVALDQADSLVTQAQAQFGAAEQDLMVRTAERYFAVLAAQDLVRLAGKEKESIGRQLEQAQQRFEVGLSAITDVQEAQARYDTTVADEIRAQNQLDSTREQLREIIGEPRENLDPVRDTDFRLVAPEPQAQQNWVDTALQQNPSLAAARAGSEAARQQIEIARSGHYPTLDANASYTYQESNFGGVFPLERNDGSIGLQLAVPLYQGGAVNSRTREARFRFDEAREQLDVTQRAIERQTRDAYRGVVTGISEVRAAEQARTSSTTALEAAETGFEVGTRTIVDVLDAQRALTLAELNLSQTRYDYLLNSLRLKQAAGTLAPADLEAMTGWLEQTVATAQ